MRKAKSIVIGLIAGFFSFFILTTACSVTNQLTVSDVSGSYYWYGIYGVSSVIELKPDSSFVYIWQEGLSGGKTTGSWSIKGRNLILNSDIQPSTDTENFFLQKWSNPTIQGTLIQVQNDELEPISSAYCEVESRNKKLNATADDEGNVMFDIKPVSRITIQFLGYRLVEFENKENTANHFKFTLQPQPHPYKYFTNEKWELRGGKIYNYRIKKDKWTRNYFERN